MFNRNEYMKEYRKGTFSVAKENRNSKKDNFCGACKWSREGCYMTARCIKCWNNFVDTKIKTGFEPKRIRVII